ncbi:MAG: GerMN domain-containing protein, partial [Sarcina sp.]
TRVLSFSIKDDVAIINLSKEAKIKMNFAKEEACLKAITSSICQLEGINKINILIENQMVDSLGSNYDISKPFAKDEINGLKKS